MEKSSFEEILKRDGKLCYSFRGVSMLPMLRQDRDLVVIQPTGGQCLAPLDVALYKRGEQYVLHRVISLKEGGYIFRGDNTYSPEYVPEDQVLGVLSSFVRNGREYAVTDPRYLRYARFWCAVYGLRFILFRCRRLVSRLVRHLARRLLRREDNDLKRGKT